MRSERDIKRRRFLSACGLTGTAILGAGIATKAQKKSPADRPQPAPPRRRYRIDIEIIECKAGKCARHRVGEAFTYPGDRGKMCEWLLDSMNGAIRVLEFGGTLPWLYEDTPYQKVIDPEGVTTEFIRCPDPTASGVVAKITRTKV
jgi:uncharacterized repeat protein (TIGR04076 family)